MEFARSAQSTLGIEWETALVDRATGLAVPAAAEIHEAVVAAHPELAEPSPEGPHVTREFLANTLEMVTGVAPTVAEAVGQLETAVAALREQADPRGIEVFSAGTHPLSTWNAEEVSAKERYQKVLERTQYWGRQMLMYGIHMHVGLDSRDKALPVVNRLTTYYPHLLALSANSPYWEGQDTGYASQRAMIFQQLPTAGLPYAFQEWEEFEGYIRDLVATGVVEEPSESRWDIRPVARYGTVEVRVCDAPSSLEEIAALTALVQCLVEETSRAVEQGRGFPVLPRWHAAENKWRAARYGLETRVVTDPDNTQKDLREDIEELVTRLEPIAEDLDCSQELAGIRHILERGPGHQRQLEVTRAHEGDLRAVVADVAARTRGEVQEPA